MNKRIRTAILILLVRLVALLGLQALWVSSASVGVLVRLHGRYLTDDIYI